MQIFAIARIIEFWIVTFHSPETIDLFVNTSNQMEFDISNSQTQIAAHTPNSFSLVILLEMEAGFIHSGVET